MSEEKKAPKAEAKKEVKKVAAMSVKVVKPEPDNGNPGGQELLKKASVEVVEQSVAPGLLISTLDHPETIQYGEASIRMSPRAREKVLDISKLPKQLPHGIRLKKL